MEIITRFAVANNYILYLHLTYERSSCNGLSHRLFIENQSHFSLSLYHCHSIFPRLRRNPLQYFCLSISRKATIVSHSESLLCLYRAELDSKNFTSWTGVPTDNRTLVIRVSDAQYTRDDLGDDIVQIKPYTFDDYRRLILFGSHIVLDNRIELPQCVMLHVLTSTV